MTNFLGKKTQFMSCSVCAIASRNPRDVPINENCFIEVGSSPWHRYASLGHVVEIDLTKRLWAPDYTLAKVWLGGQGVASQSGPH